MVVVHSATRAWPDDLAVAHSRGWLDYEEGYARTGRSSRSGKERITVRQLLAHQAGLFTFDELVDRSTVADLIA